jgi:hypothetical protein
VKLLKLNIDTSSSKILTTINNPKIESEGNTKLKVQIGTKEITHDFLVMSKLPYPCIVGLDIVRKHRMAIDGEENCLIFKSSGEKIQFHDYSEDKKPRMNVMIALPQCENSKFEISVEQKVKNILKNFPTVARTDGKLGKTDITTHEIKSALQRNRNRTRNHP